MKSFWSAFVGLLILKSIDAQDILFPTETWERPEEVSFGDCFTPKREQVQCIPLNRCKPLLDLSKKYPLSNSDLEFLRSRQCGCLDEEVLVSCPLSGGATVRVPITDSADGASLLPAPGVCGTGNFDKVVGGKKTKVDEFPWMALLNYDKLEGRKGFHCGGSLINNRYVLTASHCVNGRAIPSDWRLSSVRLGEWDTNTVTDCDDGDCNQPPVDIPIEEFIPHENYRPGDVNYLHDIALLRLSRPVTYTEFIKPVCLPSAQHLRSATFEGVSLDVAGWGRTENASTSNVKLKATVKGVDLNGCQGVYQQISISLQDSQLCAGGEEDVSSCTGDSGGAILGVDLSNRMLPYYFVAGIVSIGPNQCGADGVPIVHTRVGSYIDWIQSKIRP